MSNAYVKRYRTAQVAMKTELEITPYTVKLVIDRVTEHCGDFMSLSQKEAVAALTPNDIVSVLCKQNMPQFNSMVHTVFGENRPLISVVYEAANAEAWNCPAEDICDETTTSSSFIRVIKHKEESV